MAIRTDIAMTLSPLGNLIHSPDRRAIEARARKLRAEVVQEMAGALGATVRGWFARNSASHGHDHGRAHPA